MTNEIIMYGANWCPDCVRSKDILNERNISYTFLDITDPEKGGEYSEIIMKLNDGKRIIPTFIINDVAYANPKPSELHILLDKHTT